MPRRRAAVATERKTPMRPFILAAGLGLAALAAPAAAFESDRAGYYYPEIGSQEAFRRDLGQPPARPGRRVRTAFITQITRAQLAAPETPRFVIFAKGGEAEHMIIVATSDDVFRTLFRARAGLAQPTANARATDFFVNNSIQSEATWFDLAKLLGFEDLVISDGVTWSHRVVFE